MIRLRPILCAASALLTGTSSFADVVTITSALDNTIYQDATGTQSNGKGDFLFVGVNGGGDIRRALITLDIASAVPSGATITSSTLRLHLSQYTSGSTSIDLHRLGEEWGEGNSHASGMEGAGAPAQAGDATWWQRLYPTNDWGSPGGTHVPAVSASTSVGSSTFNSWNSVQLAADVQDMLDATVGNHGWLLKLASEGGTHSAKRFGTHDNVNPAEHPQLEIEYDPPAGCHATSFCTSTPNSSGGAAAIDFVGSCAVAANDFRLVATPVPNQMGIFYFGAEPSAGGAGIVFGNGRRCVGGPSGVYRLPVVLAAANQLSYGLDLTSAPAAGLIGPGSSWHFQAWFRDPAAGGAAFDLSDGLTVVFD